MLSLSHNVQASCGALNLFFVVAVTWQVRCGCLDRSAQQS